MRWVSVRFSWRAKVTKNWTGKELTSQVESGKTSDNISQSVLLQPASNFNLVKRSLFTSCCPSHYLLLNCFALQGLEFFVWAGIFKWFFNETHVYRRSFVFYKFPARMMFSICTCTRYTFECQGRCHDLPGYRKGEHPKTCHPTLVLQLFRQFQSECFY